ncbi:unnamed protein product [Musa acuminata subsp. malaccensis]|uniref:(wild Malaysian banana) hypothetical protein n=1 Tax=Musa acuminata subsp. malaccensis TaxID=214687 RepID=A0A804ITP4_MUSAM|nr:unnamed protein product [Musa acuminata subsp. malaccensis]
MAVGPTWRLTSTWSPAGIDFSGWLAFHEDLSSKSDTRMKLYVHVSTKSDECWRIIKFHYMYLCFPLFPYINN